MLFHDYKDGRPLSYWYNIVINEDGALPSFYLFDIRKLGTNEREFTDKLLDTPSKKWLGLAKEEVKRFGLDKVKDVGIKR